MIIKSLKNSQVKTLVKLRKKRQREKIRKILIDGKKPITLALGENFPLVKIYYNEKMKDDSLIQKAKKKYIELQAVTPEVSAKICYGNNPDGYLALGEYLSKPLENIQCSNNSLFIITEALEKPGNIGAVLRSADAAGATAHLICDPDTDIYNPNVIRSSRGTIFTVPFAAAAAEDIIKWLKKNEIKIFSAFPDAETSYIKADFIQPCAIAVGNENRGLTDIWRKEKSVKINMYGKIDSLNAAQTATILLFEARRQRSL